MDTWNTMTTVRAEGGGEEWMKDGEGISQKTYT